MQSRSVTLLRGHHLVCLHFFNGEGYDRDFIMNLEHVLTDLLRSPAVVVSGPDAVCRKCRYLSDERCSFAADADREIQAMDAEALRMLNLSPGDRRPWQQIREMMPRVLPAWANLFCSTCTWRSTCEKSELYRRLTAGP